MIALLYGILYGSAIALGLFAIAVTIFLFIYLPVVERIFSEPPMLLADSARPWADGEDVEFPAADGLRLSGTYFKTVAKERLGVLLFCHELNGDRWGAGRYLEGLRRDGFDLFTFDFRNHGASASQPGYQPLPWLTQYELSDLQGVMDYLMGRPDHDPVGVGVLGVSRGGTAAVCQAARDRRIKALVTDGAFPIAGMQRYFFRKYSLIYVPMPRFWRLIPDWTVDLASLYARVVVGLKRGCRFVNVEAAARRVRQPVLMIHGERDSMVPLAVAKEFRSWLSGPKRLWIVPKAKHNAALTVARKAYHHKLERFFLRYLADHEDEQPSRSTVEESAGVHSVA